MAELADLLFVDKAIDNLALSGMQFRKYIYSAFFLFHSTSEKYSHLKSHFTHLKLLQSPAVESHFFREDVSLILLLNAPLVI